MSNELEIKNTQIAVSEKDIISYMDASGLTASLSKDEKTMFIKLAQINNLNPFKREIYMTAYGTGQYRKTAIITGYEVYIKRAEMSGRLDGWGVVTDGNLKDGTLKAAITIHRKDFDKPFLHEVYYDEYVQKTKTGEPNKFWKEKPITMIKKVAISQGFRLCFNEVLGGLPYTKNEFLDEIESDIIQEQSKDLTPVEVSDDNKILVTDLLAKAESREDLETIWHTYPELHNDTDVKEAFKSVAAKISKSE